MKKSDSDIRKFVKQPAVFDNLVELHRNRKAQFSIPHENNYMNLITKFALCDDAKVELTADGKLDGKLTEREEQIGSIIQRDVSIILKPGVKEPSVQKASREILRKLSTIISGLLAAHKGRV